MTSKPKKEDHFIITYRLSLIQQQLVAKKSQRNDFGKYNYRSCEDILEAVKPLLGDAYLKVSDEIVQVGERYYVKATATLGNYEGETVEAVAYAREALTKKGMDEAQITGSASSYARKYALNGLFAIDDTKDPDTMDNRKLLASPPNEEIMGEFRELYEKMSEDARNAIGINRAISSLDDLPKMTRERISKGITLMRSELATK